MEIKEFYYINSQGQTIGPVSFIPENISLISPDTYVWHAAMGAEWRKARMVPEFIAMVNACTRPKASVPPPFVAPEQTARAYNAYPSRAASVPKGQQGGSTTQAAPKKQNKNVWPILIVITIVAMVLAAVFSFVLSAPIASAFNTKPLNVGFVIGGFTLVVSIILRLAFRSSKYMTCVPLCGLIIGAVFPLIAFARFDDNGSYKNGILISNNVYNSWGNRIYSGWSGVNRVSGPLGIKILVVKRSNVDNGYEYSAMGYDEDGTIVYSHFTPVVHGNSWDLDEEFKSFLQGEGIVFDGYGFSVSPF